jgi:hypothetical protein
MLWLWAIPDPQNQGRRLAGVRHHASSLVTTKTPIRAPLFGASQPWISSIALANGRVEKLIGSIRRERLDHVIILGGPHLGYLLSLYHSSHQSLTRTRRFRVTRHERQDVAIGGWQDDELTFTFKANSISYEGRTPTYL